MPSQEDYLDSIAKGLPTEEELTTNATEGQAPDMDTLTNLSEEEIDKILSVKTEETKVPGTEAEEAYGDVLDMLDGTDDGNLQEIQDLLQKSDRNEIISHEETEDGDNPADKLLADIEGTDGQGTVSTAADKKRQRALRKERRKKEKAAKKAAKQKGKKKGRKADDLEESGSFDRDMLDSIVSGAGQFGRRNGSTAEQAGSGAGLAVEEVDLEDAAGIVPDVESEFAAVDIDEIDALIPDISEKKEEKAEEKKGFFSKAVSFLLEEEEEEPENEDIPLSDENQKILDDLDKESGKGKTQKAKKGKKKGAKKDKKKEIKKKAKPPKKKKEKKPKPKEEEPYVPGRRLTFKKMLPVLLLGATIGAVIFIFVNISSDYMDKQVAETAFSNGDYDTCYLNLYGKKRNEAQEIMYGKSESILYMRLWYGEYEMLAEEGLEAEALDSLIQTVKDYQTLYDYALQWDAVSEISEIYSNLLNILSIKYALSEEQALEISAVTSDIEYTRIVTALAAGESYGTWGRPAPQPEEEEELQILPDELPEETEMEPGEFVDNQ